MWLDFQVVLRLERSHRAGIAFESEERLSVQNRMMLAAHTSARPSNIHLKSDLIAKLTAAINPIEARPPTNAPSHAPVWCSRYDVSASVIARTPVARTYPPITRNTCVSHASRPGRMLSSC